MASENKNFNMCMFYGQNKFKLINAYARQTFYIQRDKLKFNMNPRK